MRRTITSFSIAAAAVLALTSCASAAADPTVPAAPGATPSAAMPTGHTHSHTAEATPSASASASSTASEEHSEHTDADHDDHDAPGQHDDSYKDVALKKGTTYVIASSTDQTRFRLTIESFDCKTSYPEAAMTTAGTATAFTSEVGKTLCVAKVSGENIGKKPDHAALNYFAAVVDAKDTYYEETNSPHFTTQFLMGTHAPLDQSVDPGKTAWMVLGYDVPTSAKGLELRIDTAPFSH